MANYLKIHVILFLIFIFSINDAVAHSDANGSLTSTIPYLQSPSDTSIIVRWVTSKNCRGSVIYSENLEDVIENKGERVFMYENGMGIGNTPIHRIHLSNLTAGTKYYYRVCSEATLKYDPYEKSFDQPEYSDVFSFTTFDSKKEAFTILIFNDLHPNISKHSTLDFLDNYKSLIDSIKYDLVILNGDCLDDLQREREDLVSWLNQYARLFKSNYIPIIYLRGNHEIRGKMADKITNYVEYVCNGKSYGAMDLGDSRLLFLDAGEDKADDHPIFFSLANYAPYRKEQKDFLKRELNSPEFKNAKRKILIHHIPFFTEGMRNSLPPTTNEYPNSYIDIGGEELNREDISIDIAINGHTHVCEYIPKGHKYEKLPLSQITNNYPVCIGPKEGLIVLTKLVDQTLSLTVYDSLGKVKIEGEIEKLNDYYIRK